MIFSWPWDASTAITQRFGDNPNNGVNPIGGHTGIDAALANGVEFRACGDGIVVYEGWATGLPGGYNNTWYLHPDYAGIVLVIDHGAGQPVSIYGHCLATYVSIGDTITRGQIVAQADTTGLASGAHLHFEMMPDQWNLNNGTYGRVNPTVFVDRFWSDAPVPSNIRITGPNGVNRRSAPDKNAGLIDTFPGDREITVGGFVVGTDPYGDDNKVWYVGGLSGGYMHSSGFTSQDTTGLKDLTPAITPPVPETPNPMEPAPYSFDLDFLSVNGISVENIPANLTNVDKGTISTTVYDVVDHWWNSLVNRPTMNGVISEFQRKDAFKSSHWVVSDTRIVQMVSTKDRAYHAGPVGNNHYGIECDPYITEKNPDGTYTDRAKKIQDNVRALHVLLETRSVHVFTLHLHKEFMNTSCSDIDLLTVTPNRIVPPVEPPVNELDEFLDWAKTTFRNSTWPKSLGK